MCSMKYMKLKSLIFFGLISLTGFAQDASVDLPNFTPPSPEASAMTKYGDIPVTEHTGMVNSSIPIYNYRSGNLELPISINYSGTGVKVDDLSTWTGINWVLNAGGVITRTIKDRPDESSGTTRVFLDDTETTNYFTNLINGSSNASYLYSLIGDSNVYDTEVDIFNISMPGYSGSFYLDENFNPILIKNDNPIKIELANDFLNSKTIIITASDGVKFTFGGFGGTEDTELRYISGGALQTVNFQGTTAFYLKQIEHPLNGIIYLEYSNDMQFYNVQLTKEQSKNSIPQWLNTDNNQMSCCSNNPYSSVSTSINTTIVANRVYEPKFLSRIYNNLSNEEVVFNSKNVDNANFKKVLQRIKIIRANDSIKTVDFEYTDFEENESSNPNGYSDVTKRFFLTKVIFDKYNNINYNSSNGRRNEVFTFEYNYYNQLPSRFSYAQDQLGFYNGKNLNTSLIPDNPNFNPNNYNNFADRTSNFNYAFCGTLKKIIYPTGGYSLFEYESPKAKKRVTETISLSTYRNQSGLVDTSDLYDGVPKISDGVDTDGDGVFDTYSTIFGNPMLEDETINISVSASAYLSNNYPTFFPNQEKVTLKFTDLSTNISIDKIISFTQPGGPNNEGYINKTNNYAFNLEAGKLYKVELFIQDTSTEETLGTEVPMLATATFSYFKEYETVDRPGIRIKRISNYSDESSPSNIKRYYYSPIDNIVQNVDLLPDETIYYKITNSVKNFICQSQFNGENCYSPIPLTEFVLAYNTLHSNSIDNYFNILGSGVYDKVSISYGGDNFENGGVEKTFYYNDGLSILEKICQPIFGQPVYEIVTNSNGVVFPSELTGEILKEKTYINKNNALSKITEKAYTYDFNQLTHINNLQGSLKYPILQFPSGTAINNCLSNYFIGHFRTNSYRKELLSINSIEYIDPVPLGVQDESIYKKIVSIQNYQYGNLRGLPTVITSSSSESGINNITKNFYVTDNLSGLGLSSGQVNLLSILANKNIVNKPIQTEQFQNTEKLSTIRTVYKNISTNSNFYKIVPDIIESSKENQTLEKRVRFLEYDGFGRPTLVSLENGAKTKYYYNVRGQVVMKIENYIAPVGTGTSFTGEDVESSTSPCNYQTMFPASLVTVFEYDLVNNQIVKIIDSNCIETNYEYDELNRLIYIKDNEGNIMQEFDSSFKRY